jgi:hypothetical protein
LCIAVAAFSVLLGRAHSADLGTITILAQEEGTRLPIAGAKVTLGGVGDSAKAEAGVTDNSGSHRFPIARAGAYFPRITAEGYVLRSTLHEYPVYVEMEDKPANTRDANPLVTFTLYKPVSISGNLYDEATKQPLAGLKVNAVEAVYREGKRRFQEGRGRITTDSEGAFLLKELPPGEYFLQVEDTPAEEIVARRQPDYSDEYQPAKQYGRQYWPEIDGASAGLVLHSGAALDAGKIELSQKVLGRIRGRIRGDTCSERDRVYLSLKPEFPDLSLQSHQVEIKCGAQFTIQHLAARTYQVEAWIGELGIKDGRFARESVTLNAGSDIELALALQKALPVTGKLICDCQNPDQARFKEEIWLNSRRASHFPAANPSTVRDDGTFETLAIAGSDVELGIRPLATLYLKQIVYNGAKVETVFALNSYAVSHTLEVTLSDKSAEVSGAVSANGSPMARASVVLAAWPLRLIDGYPDYLAVETTASGTFQFRKLPPGTYRIVGVGPLAWEQVDLPGVLANWIASGEEITIGENAVKTVAIESKIP